jgi:DNA-directed RNA polymerase subunit RPC12/RpoP
MSKIMENTYYCHKCGAMWTELGEEDWDSECPECGHLVEYPTRSIE